MVSLSDQPSPSYLALETILIKFNWFDFNPSKI